MEELTIRLMEELRKNAILLRRCFHRPGPQVGQHSRLLTILLENPGISQRALSDLLHIRPQSMGEQLAKLESSGLITRQVNQHDRRVFNLYLTDEGVAAGWMNPGTKLPLQITVPFAYQTKASGLGPTDEIHPVIQGRAPHTHLDWRG